MTMSRRTVLGAGVVAGMAASARAQTAAPARSESATSIEAARRAAAGLPAGTKIRIIGKGDYEVVEAAKAHLPPLSGAKLGLLVKPVCGTFIAEQFGDAANAETAQYAVSAACRSSDVKSVLFGGGWSIDSTVVFDDPDDVFVSAGRASGARATIDEVYKHRWPFRIPQPTIYLVASDPQGNKFVPGESVAGVESRAIAQLAETAHTQTALWHDFLLGGANHFESHDSNGAVGIRLRDRLRRGPQPTLFDLRVGRFFERRGVLLGSRSRASRTSEYQGGSGKHQAAESLFGLMSAAQTLRCCKTVMFTAR